jgi:hypothetical protein
MVDQLAPTVAHLVAQLMPWLNLSPSAPSSPLLTPSCQHFPVLPSSPSPKPSSDQKVFRSEISQEGCLPGSYGPGEDAFTRDSSLVPPSFLKLSPTPPIDPATPLIVHGVEITDDHIWLPEHVQLHLIGGINGQQLNFVDLSTSPTSLLFVLVFGSSDIHRDVFARPPDTRSPHAGFNPDQQIPINNGLYPFVLCNRVLPLRHHSHTPLAEP